MDDTVLMEVRLHRSVRILRICQRASQVQQAVIARETMKRGG